MLSNFKQMSKAKFRALLVLLFLLSVSMTALAQDPVTLDIPTDDIFTSINSWIVTFVPVVAIGIGIAAALAILGFVGNEIIKAFKGGRSR